MYLPIAGHRPPLRTRRLGPIRWAIRIQSAWPYLHYFQGYLENAIICNQFNTDANQMKPVWRTLNKFIAFKRHLLNNFPQVNWLQTKNNELIGTYLINLESIRTLYLYVYILFPWIVVTNVVLMLTLLLMLLTNYGLYLK